MQEPPGSEPENSWKQIAPHLDAALGELDELTATHCCSVILKKSAREMADILRISDEAAQKRVACAAERLREHMLKRGVTASVGGIAVAISANAVQAAPASLAALISSAALAGATVSTGEKHFHRFNQGQCHDDISKSTHCRNDRSCHSLEFIKRTASRSFAGKCKYSRNNLRR